MPPVPDEIAGLPEGGPATLDGVKAQLRIPDADHTEDARLTLYVDAVNDQIRTWPVAERAVDQEAWPGSIVLGAVMLCARLDARRGSPDGVSAFAEGGPVYVQRTDPDVAQMLQLGAWARPAVG